MNDRDYLEIILKGLLGNTGDYYANHIYREWKKAEVNHYSLEEFFSGLIRQHKGLKEEINRQYCKGLNEFYIIQGIYESEGKDIKQLDGQEPKEDNYSINLFLLTTDPRYLGLTLRQSDLIYVGGQIAIAFEKAEKEKRAIDEPKPKEPKKIRYHQDFIKRAIEILFTEQIERSRETEGDNFLPTAEGIKVEYIDIPINDRNAEKLNEIATKRLSEFINQHDDNTKQMFVENEIEIAKEYQSYFPKFKIDREEKEYYFKLQRWIDCLNELSKRDATEGNNSNKTLKGIFVNEATYNQCMEALRNVNAPVISGDNKYLLGPRQKGAFTAWYEVVKFREKFKAGVIASEVARLLNKEIEGLGLFPDGSTLSRPGTSSYKKYKTPLLKLIQ